MINWFKVTDEESDREFSVVNSLLAIKKLLYNFFQ